MIKHQWNTGLQTDADQNSVPANKTVCAKSAVVAKWAIALAVGAVLPILSLIGQARADQFLQLAQPKAANLARMRAETLNGGLGAYRADQCMYVTGAEACLVSKTEAGFTFRFLGGPPGWQQLSPPAPTIETTLLISPDGGRIVEVTYNGPVR